ncbi:sodium channel regulatory subunit beta-3-like isoform X3 [Channa argus]|uniref:sodium channel regulatory subunit beta-3-like isoform X3 n=1 Tax=Channa argus TaxID=215402 RepID=UPI003521757B
MILVRIAWSFLIFASASAFEVQKEIEVKPGEDATLQCQCPRHADITLLEWSRPELKKDGYVFFYRNSRPYENYQHQFFMGRVELRNESSVKDGDVSVILKNVNISDTGTYECRIVISNPGSSGRTTTELKHLITLKVSESGNKAENNWDGGNNLLERGAVLVAIAVGLTVVAVVLVGIIFILFRIYKKKPDTGNS